MRHALLHGKSPASQKARKAGAFSSTETSEETAEETEALLG